MQINGEDDEEDVRLAKEAMAEGPPIPYEIARRRLVLQKLIYSMECPAGRYESKSWIGLGWTILCHRFWHLYKNFRWMD